MITDFGQLNLSNILEFVNNDGKQTYSFLIEKDSTEVSSFAFENLHLINNSGEFFSYILRWDPELFWLENNNFKFNVETFTGTQTHYDLDYNIIQETEFINGNPLDSTDKTKVLNDKESKMDMELICVEVTRSLCSGIPYDCGGVICGFGSNTQGNRF